MPDNDSDKQTTEPSAPPENTPSGGNPDEPSPLLQKATGEEQTPPSQPKSFNSLDDIAELLPPEAREALKREIRKERDRAITGYRKKLEARQSRDDDDDGLDTPTNQPKEPEKEYLTREEFLAALEARERARRQQEEVVNLIRSVCAEYGWGVEDQRRLVEFVEQEEKDPNGTFSTKDLRNRKGLLAAARAAGLFDKPLVEPLTGAPTIGPKEAGKADEGAFPINRATSLDVELKKGIVEEARRRGFL